MEPNNYSVDIAKMKVATPPDKLFSLALGSCVGVAIFDPAAHIGGLIHVLLPSILELQGGTHSRTKFADSGISDLVDALIGRGASKYRMKAKIAGGATMFAVGDKQPGFSIGIRNVTSCRETLKKLGIDLIAQDVGGTKGRSIYFDIETGRLTIKVTSAGEKVI